MKFKILDSNGNIINTIIAELEFVQSNYEYFEVIEEPIVSDAQRVPQTITKLQAMKQMKAIGKWEAFKTVLANDEDVNDEWVLSDNLNRSYPLVLSVAQLFEFSDEDMDNFFIEASKL